MPRCPELIEGEIQTQHIDGRVSQETEKRRFNVLSHKRSDLFWGHASRRSYTRDLRLGCGW